MHLNYKGRDSLRAADPELAQRLEIRIEEDAQKFAENEMDAEDIASFAYTLDPNLAKSVLDTVGISHFDREAMVERYEEMLDVDGEVTIAGHSYYPSRLLKAADEVGYNEGFKMYVDGQANLSDNSYPGAYGWDNDLYVDRDELQEIDLEELRESMLDEAPQLRAFIEERNLERNTAQAPARYATDDWAPTPEQKTQDMGRLTASLSQGGDDEERRPVRARGMRL